MVRALDGTYVPLYRDQPPPALTDEEREALERCAEHTSGIKVAAALRGLLARLGGER